MAPHLGGLVCTRDRASTSGTPSLTLSLNDRHEASQSTGEPEPSSLSALNLDGLAMEGRAVASPGRAAHPPSASEGKAAADAIALAPAPGVEATAQKGTR